MQAPAGRDGDRTVRPDQRRVRLERTDVFRLWALLALDYIELDLLVLLQGTVSAGCDGRVVGKDIC
jgi:hypothetical protein